jgi:ABC-type sugar transport system substrate-binding protein
MNLSKLFAATACVAALTAVSTSALAATAPDGQYEYRVGPPPSNPHDVFRPVIRTAKPDAAVAAKDCPCPMMQGPASQTPNG